MTEKAKEKNERVTDDANEKAIVTEKARECNRNGSRNSK